MRNFLVGLLPLFAASWCATGVGCGGAAFTASSSDGGTSGSDGGPRDGAGDVDATPGEAGASWCSTQTPTPDFCEDFDEYPADAGGLLGGSNWPSYGQSNGSFDLDTTNPKSAPNALQVVGDDGARMFLVHSLPALATLPRNIKVEFDLRVNSPGTEAATAVAGFGALAFGDSLDSGYAAVSIAKGPVLSIAWVTPANNKFNAASGPMGSVPSAGQWAGRYGIEIDLGPTSGGTGCALAYQAPHIPLTTCLPLPAGLAKPGVMSIVLGDVAGGLGMVGHVDLEFDNVNVVIAR
jgi:hypothetical protein